MWYEIQALFFEMPELLLYGQGSWVCNMYISIAVLAAAERSPGQVLGFSNIAFLQPYIVPILSEKNHTRSICRHVDALVCTMYGVPTSLYDSMACLYFVIR